MRATGLPSIQAFYIVFGYPVGHADYDGLDYRRAEGIESTKTYLRELEEAQKLFKADRKNSEAFAIMTLMEIINGEKATPQARLKALDTYMMLLDITIIDDNGNTRKRGSSMGEFYKKTEDNSDLSPEEMLRQAGVERESNTTH